MIIPDRTASGLDRLAATATTHCLTGCAIGEVAGMVIATALGWGSTASIAPPGNGRRNTPWAPA